MILVDTSVWVDLFSRRHTPQVVALKDALNRDEDLCLCGVILTEILQGIRDDLEFQKTESILSELMMLPMRTSTFKLVAHIYRKLRQNGITIRNSVDCMIAAVCLENGVELLHNDRDFEFISTHFELSLVSI